MTRLRHLYATTSYNRKIGVLVKDDYLFMRECLENYLEYIQGLDIDNHDEIDILKILFIKLDHHINRLYHLNSIL